MKKLGLIGFPLSHSFSPGYFKKKFETLGIEGWQYGLYPLDKIDAFCALMEDEKPFGINVTIPYKEQVIPFLDELDKEAAEIGAVNTIKISNQKTKGFNTDIYGFEKSIEPLLKNHHKNALILGSGGASKAVEYALKKMGIAPSFVSRTAGKGQFTYEDLNAEILENQTIIVNTTPLGMSPNIDACSAIPYNAITPHHLLYDLVYNPTETLFLKKGKQQGAAIKNGYEMLCLQADKSWEIWTEDGLI